MFNISKALTKSYIKIIPKKSLFNRYMTLNNDILRITEDINDLKEAQKYGEDITDKTSSLEKVKKKLEIELLGIEEKFYDIKKGLWIGVAWDLDETGKDPFLLYLPFKNLHNHIEVFGTSGYGKTRLMAIMVRQFIHYNWSCFVVDPKGGDKQEIAQWIYDFAIEAGMEHLVMRIMPAYPSISDKGNPLFGMSDIEIASMCSSLMDGGSGSQSSNEQFFSGQVYRIAYAILSAFTYLENAVYPDKIGVNKQVIAEVKRYISFKNNMQGEKFYEDENIKFPDISKIASKPVKIEDKDIDISEAPIATNRTLITFKELAYYSSYEHLKELENLVENTPIPSAIIHDKQRENEIKNMRDTAIRTLKELTSLDEAFYIKTGTSLSILLSQLAFGPIGEVFCDIRINPLVKRARDKEGMIVIFQPAPMRFEKVSEMLIKIYTKMWLSLFGTIGTSGRGINKRVALIIDEAKPMMFPGIEEIYNKARQLGMSIMALYQSKSDLKYKLGETLADIVHDNTNTTITMKQISLNSQVETAASFGKVKIAENVQMTEADGTGRTTVVYGEVDKIAPEDIDKLGIGEGYIRHGGKHYFVKFPYQRDPAPINVVMPKLESENSFDLISSIENMLIEQEMEKEVKLEQTIISDTIA